jgi:hypothetical protein
MAPRLTCDSRLTLDKTPALTDFRKHVPGQIKKYREKEIIK